MRDSCVCDAAFFGQVFLIFVGASGPLPLRRDPSPNYFGPLPAGLLSS